MTEMGEDTFGTFTEQRLRELSNRLAEMRNEPREAGARASADASAEATARLRAAEERLGRDAARDTIRLESAERDLRALRAQLALALAASTSGAPGSAARAAGPSRPLADDAARGGTPETEASVRAGELAMALRYDLERERRRRDLLDERRGREVADELASLGGQIAVDRDERDAQEARVRAAAAEQLAAVHAALDAERAAREASHDAFLTMLEELTTRAREEIAHERAQREASDKLLRELCGRVGLA
jgi:hypothetical protein